MLIDPGAITLVQTTFIQHISDAFQLISHYALNILYLFAIFEVVVFGLLWAFQQSASWGSVFFKVIKIGLIFFIIQNYAWLLDVIIKSFAQIGGVVADTKNLNQYVFNPAAIWQYGYDVSLNLLKVAAVSGGGIGLSITQVALGLGILLVFGLLGIQIVLQVVGFYLISLIALILLPFGTFSPSSGMFDKSVQAVLKAGVRVAVLIMVMGIAVTVWNSFGAIDLSSYNINQPLGLFFTALLFLYLAIRLPYLAADAVGMVNIHFRSEEGVSSVAVVHGGMSTATPVVAVSGESSTLKAATAIEPTSQSAAMGVSPAQTAAASTVTVSPTMQTQTASGVSSLGAQERRGKSDVTKASDVEKSISDATLKKIKKTFVQALKEKNN
jgi:type IV secretory pathway TrbL component